MSPLHIPAGYANFNLTLSNALGGASSVNSIAIGVKCTATIVQADVARIANLLRDGLTPRYDANWLLGPTRCVENVAGIIYAFDDTGTEAGTHAAQANGSPSLAVVVSKVSGLRGRSFQGRVYMPGPDETKIDEAGILDGAEVNAWQASFDALQTALVADASIDSLAIFHDDASPFAAFPTVINSFVVRNVLGSMRPRQRR